MSKDYESIPLGEYRIKKLFTIFGLSCSGSPIIWTGKWIGFIYVQQQKYKERFREFDDGWSYKYYWSKWTECWEHEKIIE